MSKYDKKNYLGVHVAPYFVRVSCAGEVFDQTARCGRHARFIGSSLAQQQADGAGQPARWGVWRRAESGRLLAPQLYGGEVAPRV